MLGGSGLAHSSKLALLNANYIAHRLKNHYTIRYTNVNGRVAHELLIDLAEFDKSVGLKVSDFAKRLQVGDSLLVILCSPYVFFPYNAGFRLPPSNMFLADHQCYAHRTHRIRDSRGTR
jgi:glycine cleavage system protein P-like pyridoxal-binding family